MNMTVRQWGEASPARHEARGHSAPLALRAIEKRYGRQPVLAGLDLDVPAGQFIAVVGRSGSGKSTLLRVLSGLEPPTAGSIRVGDAPVEEARASLRVMFQEPRLLPWARVLANVEVGLGPDRRRADAKDRAREALRLVGLGDRARDWPGVLSGGQKQRVALARALVSRPRLLALDEPLGALDALTRIEMQRLIGRSWQEEEFTAVLVTHDVTEAVMLADRIVLLEGGSIALDLPVPLDRSRRRGAPELAALEERILERLLGEQRHAATPVLNQMGPNR